MYQDKVQIVHLCFLWVESCACVLEEFYSQPLQEAIDTGVVTDLAYRNCIATYACSKNDVIAFTSGTTTEEAIYVLTCGCGFVNVWPVDRIS